MKKYVLFCLLCLLFVFPQIAKSQLSPPRRGLFISVIQDPPVLSNRNAIEKLIDFSKKANVHTLFVQIYRANKAWFPSKVGDSTPYESSLKSVGEDPFALLIKEAHASGLEVHAWLNLLSLSGNKNAPLLKKYGKGILTRNVKRKWRLKSYKIDNQYFLEPGDLRVREELSTMVEEILRTYPHLDGIQFDYIRYPDKHPFYGYTKMNMERFKKASGLKKIEEESKVWKDWKRDQVTDFLKLLVQKTRAIRPDIQISTTGLMPYSRAYHEGYQDWKLWLESGAVNFITLMCYKPEPSDLEKYILDAKIQTAEHFKNVNIAVPAYQLVKAHEKFDQQFELCEKAESRGCVVFHYGSLLEDPALTSPLIGSEAASMAMVLNKKGGKL